MNWEGLKQKLINSKYYYFHTENGVLLNGDCLDVLGLLPEKGIDLILTDPPYNISKDSNFHLMKDRKNQMLFKKVTNYLVQKICLLI